MNHPGFVSQNDCNTNKLNQYRVARRSYPAISARHSIRSNERDRLPVVVRLAPVPAASSVGIVRQHPCSVGNDSEHTRITAPLEAYWRHEGHITQRFSADQSRTRIDALFRRNVPRGTDHAIRMESHVSAADMHTTARPGEGFTTDFDP